MARGESQHPGCDPGTLIRDHPGRLPHRRQRHPHRHSTGCRLSRLQPPGTPITATIPARIRGQRPAALRQPRREPVQHGRQLPPQPRPRGPDRGTRNTTVRPAPPARTAPAPPGAPAPRGHRGQTRRQRPGSLPSTTTAACRTPTAGRRQRPGPLGPVPASGRTARYAPSRDACPAIAPAVRPDTTHAPRRCPQRDRAGRRRLAPRPRPRKDLPPRITWALVPLIPTRTPPGPARFSSPVVPRNRPGHMPAAQSPGDQSDVGGDGSSTGGSAAAAVCRASNHLDVPPAAPAAAGCGPGWT